jgi:hypothetical protein
MTTDGTGHTGNHDSHHDGVGSTRAPDDATLLAAIARLWQQVDPPPTDLVDGVLAAIAAEDLEFELLTLVEGADALAGVRHAAPEDGDETGAWSLEYEGPDFHVYVRLSRVEGRHRLDGWVVPARPVTVLLRTEGREATKETSADEFGRFEFPEAPAGVTRLGFTTPGTTEADDSARPRITPPFWI